MSDSELTPNRFVASGTEHRPSRENASSQPPSWEARFPLPRVRGTRQQYRIHRRSRSTSTMRRVRRLGRPHERDRERDHQDTRSSGPRSRATPQRRRRTRSITRRFRTSDQGRDSYRPITEPSQGAESPPGYGSDRRSPATPPEDGREKKPRVEFVILERT